MCGYALVALGIVAAIRILIEREPVMSGAIAAGTLVGVISLATLVHPVAPGG